MTDINSRPVVITRPAAQAQAFAAQVAAIGRQVVVFPLLCITPLDDLAPLRTVLARLSNYAMVVFVSPNAIDAVFGQLQQWPSGVDIGIIGEGSRLALQQHGVSAVNTTIIAPPAGARMDSEELFKALNLAQLYDKRVLIVRAQTGRDFLTDRLCAAQVEVHHVSAYQRRAPPLDAACLTQLAALLEIDNEWIVSSSEALHNLIDMTQAAFGAINVAKIQRKHLIVSHHRIVETAQSLGFSCVTMSGSGDERLIAALQSLHERTPSPPRPESAGS